MGLASAAVGVAGGLAQGIMGASQASKAKKAIASYRRTELTNVADGLSVATLGSDIAKEELARTSASSIQALQQSGVRGAVGGIGAVQKSTIAQASKIRAGLDEQQKEIEKLKAQDELRIQTMTEARENADLAGLGQQQAVGQQNMFGGLAGVGKAVGAFAGMGDAYGGETPQVASSGSPSAQGATSLTGGASIVIPKIFQ